MRKSGFLKVLFGLVVAVVGVGVVGGGSVYAADQEQCKIEATTVDAETGKTSSEKALPIYSTKDKDGRVVYYKTGVDLGGGIRVDISEDSSSIKLFMDGSELASVKTQDNLSKTCYEIQKALNGKNFEITTLTSGRNLQVKFDNMAVSYESGTTGNTGWTGSTAAEGAIKNDEEKGWNKGLNHEEEDSGEDSEDVGCFDKAGALGWILCPVLTGLSNITEGFYDKLIKPALEFDSQLIKSDDTSGASANGAYGAWNAFRNIANILFVILLMVVIFSQLTGVGIDNYGIKKILPKLIIVAVLTNLSYLICQVLVDVSNIVGNGLQGLLDGMSPLHGSTDGKLVGGGSTSIGRQLATTGFEFATLIIGGGAAFLFVDLGAIITLLLALLAGLFSLFMLFLLLAVRKAAIIILIAAVPVAAVTYMLPNLKKRVFDVWWKGMSALLLLYPLCSLAMGGGGLASDIILSTGAGNVSLLMAVTSYICAIAPVFFIPSMLKGSFKALGNIGATISGVGQGVKKGTLGRFAKSDMARRMRTGLSGVGNNGIRKTAAEGLSKVPGLRTLGNAALGSYALRTSMADKQRNDDARARNLLNNREAMMARESNRRMMESTEAEEALLNNGRAQYTDASGVLQTVNSNNVGQVKAFHAQALERYNNATSEEERDRAIAQVRAAQNILSKNEKGREAVRNNLEMAVNAAADGNLSDAQKATRLKGLQYASSHLFSEYGDTYKNKARGAHELIRDLASGTAIDTINGKIGQYDNNGTRTGGGIYDQEGINKYTEEALAGADEFALEGLKESLPTLDATNAQMANKLRNTAYQALENYRNGRLNIKPEVREKLEQIAAGYTPQVDNNRARIISHGAYKEQGTGRVVHLRQLDNGKYVDDGGFEVDITHYSQH